MARSFYTARSHGGRATSGGAYLIRERNVPVATALSQARQINLMDEMRMSDQQPLEGFLGHVVPEMAHPKQ